jgi:tetratricopeptide (TPR) repeat protein
LSRPVHKLALPAIIAALVLRIAPALADECGGPCGDDVECSREVAACLVEDGANDEAIELLKTARADHQADGPLARLLARAYLGNDNRVWAIKTLLAQLQAAPDDLETRTWAVWLLIQDGDLAQADSVLAQADAPAAGPMAERVALLRATLHKLLDEHDKAEQQLDQLEERDGDLYPEDVDLYESVRSQLGRSHGDPLQVRALVSGGYTSNATQSAPQDTGAGLDESGAPIVSVDLVLRVEPWTSTFVRPLAEVRSKGFLPTTDKTRQLGYLSLGGRGGIELGRTGELRARFLYSYDLFGLLKNARGWDDDPETEQGWYMTAHRGEVEVDVLPELQVFGGAGRRIYQHLPRTRTELDVGLAAVFPLSGGWNLTGIMAGRMQFARNQAFDDRGLTGLVRVRVPLPEDFMIKLRVMGLYDVYPDSAAYYRSERRRRDFLLKAEAGPWTPSFHGLRVGLTYTLAHRISTIESIEDNFNYTDHRVLLQLRWQGSFDPTLPGTVRVGDDHQPLPYGLDEGRDSGLDRVQDLLRQEDSARRGSMCVD